MTAPRTEPGSRAGDAVPATARAAGAGSAFTPGRVAAFSDGVMAIAITLLILNLHLPDAIARTNLALQQQLRALEAPFVAFLLSFAVIAVWWNSHHRLFGALEHGDRGILLLNFVFLAAVVFLPFPTSVLGRYASLSTAVVLYAATNAVIGAAAFLMWWHADRSDLLAPEPSGRERHRIMIYAATAPVVFALSIPVALVRPDLAPWSWNVVWVVVVAMRLWWRLRPTGG